MPNAKEKKEIACDWNVFKVMEPIVFMASSMWTKYILIHIAEIWSKWKCQQQQQQQHKQQRRQWKEAKNKNESTNESIQFHNGACTIIEAKSIQCLIPSSMAASPSLHTNERSNKKKTQHTETRITNKTQK